MYYSIVLAGYILQMLKMKNLGWTIKNNSKTIKSYNFFLLILQIRNSTLFQTHDYTKTQPLFFIYFQCPDP